MIKSFPPVIGLGLPKTGTASLRTAIKHFGYEMRGWDYEAACQFVDGNLDLFAVVDSNTVYADMPWCCVYKEIDAIYKAKFVLTFRDEYDWIRSVLRHLNYKKHPDTKGGSRIREMYFGAEWPQGNEELYLMAYRRHNKSVRDFFSDKDNFIAVSWDSAGWPELCGLLGKKVPNIPFPHVNEGRLYE